MLHDNSFISNLVIAIVNVLRQNRFLQHLFQHKNFRTRIEPFEIALKFPTSELV